MNLPFSEEEVKKLRELIEIVEVVKEEAEYRTAVRLVLRTWKNIVIAVGATIGAIILLKDFLHKLWQVFVGS